MEKYKSTGLIGDLWTNIKCMQISGHWLLEYYEENSGLSRLLRILYCSLTTILIVAQLGFITTFVMLESYDTDEMATGTITTLFFLHSITKFLYFAMRSKYFYRVLRSWNQVNSHPLFAESNARHRAVSLMRTRKLFTVIAIGTIITVLSWTAITFIGDSTRKIRDPANANETIRIVVPKLMLPSWYPWDSREGMGYVFTFVYQFYWLFNALAVANLLDVLFCSFVIFACEQLSHLKEIMKPLMELSAALGSAPTNEVYRLPSATEEVSQTEDSEVTYRSVYNSQREFSSFTGASRLILGGMGVNGYTKKQELLVRSAIKYWVERHKKVVKYVSEVGEAYGSALLLHMLISTVTLTLLAYQATKIEGIDMFSVTVLGYLFYTLAQVFVFCFYGNRLIEESSSVMEAAYSCQWYEGSEEAKTFVQIVCQQSQKSLTVSGARFFTISLDLFASVLGAVVTYFMVLVQLK